MNNRKRKRKITGRMKQLCAIILSICMLVGSVAQADLTVYAESITKSSREYEFPGCQVTYKVNNSWSNYVTVEMTVENTGETTIRDWAVTFDYDGIIDNIWSAQIEDNHSVAGSVGTAESGVTTDGSVTIDTDAIDGVEPDTSRSTTYTIIPMNYNSDIQSGASVSFGFMAYGKPEGVAPAAPENLTVKGVQNTAGEEGGEGEEEAGAFAALEYALFTSSTENLSLYTGKTSITGDVHSNGGFHYQGNTLNVEGKIEAAGTITTQTGDSEDAVQVGAYREAAKVIEMAPLTQVIVNRLKEDGDIYEKSQVFNTGNVVVDHSMYIQGSADFNTTSFLGRGIIHATDSITVNVGEMATGGGSRVFLSSENGDITLNGTDFAINAVLYAPNGCVRINAGSITINGRIIAKSVEINGTVLNINATDSDFDVLKDVLAPDARLEISGELKENRRVVVDVTETEGFDYVAEDSAVWSFTKDGEDAGELVGVDEGVSGALHKELIFREPGEYEITVTVNDGQSDYVFEETISIMPDIEPVAGAKPGAADGVIPEEAGEESPEADVSGESSGDNASEPDKESTKTDTGADSEADTGESAGENPETGMEEASSKTDPAGYYLRNAEGTANIDLTDISYSPDGDTIGSRTWEIYHDADNNGGFAPEELILSNTGKDDAGNVTDNTAITFTTADVGKYMAKITVTEHFDNTIPELLMVDDYLTDSKEIYFEVGNEKPEASFDIQKAKRADIVFTTGGVRMEDIEVINAKAEELKAQLEAEGVDANVASLQSATLTAEDTFAWEEYDHYNYQDAFDVMLEKHILYDGKDITMVGYCEKPVKDFLYVENDDPGSKIFEFEMQRDKTDWHSMEGGGFLFNTDVDGENNTIKGYAALFTNAGIRIVKIDCDDLKAFRDGELEGAWKSLLLKKSPSVYDTHHYTIATDSDSISIWVDGELYVDDYILPEDTGTYGFGPVTSHGAHGCEQQSYFTFSGITMSCLTENTLSDIVNSSVWREGAEHYLVNVSGTKASELSEDMAAAELSAALLENEAAFVGIGNGNNESRYALVLQNTAEEGMMLSYDDLGGSLDTFNKRVLNAVLTKDYTIQDYISTGEPVEYHVSYSDPENDPMKEACWEYEYDPAVFGEAGGEAGHITASYEEPLTTFENTGAYTVKLSVKDNPADNAGNGTGTEAENVAVSPEEADETGTDEAVADYGQWSEGTLYEKLLLVQTRPAGVISAELQKASLSSHCLAEVTYEASDADHPSDENGGIRKEYMAYKKLSDSQWTEGPVPNRLKAGSIYLVQYTAWDVENSAGKPAVAVLDTSKYRENEEAIDNVAPEIFITTAKNRYSVGEEIIIDVFAQDENGVDLCYTFVNGNKVSDSTGYIRYTPEKAGELTIRVSARDLAGNKSEETLKLDVKDSDVTSPKVSLTASETGTGEKTILEFIGTVTDNTAVKKYTLEYRCVEETVDDNTESSESDGATTDDGESAGNTSENTSASYILLASGTGAIEEELISTLETTTLVPGIYEVRLKAEDRAGNEAFCMLTFTASDNGGSLQPGGGDTTAPTAQFLLPEEDTVLTTPTAITGTVCDETELATYTVEYRIKGENNYTTLSEGTEPVTEGELAYLDTTILPNGIYEVRLTATDTSGNRIRTTRTYMVDGAYKPGEMFLGFTDAAAYLAGATVNVNRYYSSTNKRVGDFGYGINR